MKTRTRTIQMLAVVAATSTALAACGGGGFAGDDDGGSTAASTPTELSGSLQVMFGSSGEAETKAIQDAATRFSDETGVDVETIPAQDLVQQLQQGLAGGNPPDVFYVSPDRFQLYVQGDSLYAYTDQIEDTDDFHQSLRDAFTYEDQLYCIPKDGGTAGLVIDTDAWADAGLTEDEYPQTWDDLANVAEQLTTDDRTGLVFSGEYNTIGAFMLQAGGYYVNEDQTEVTADSPENIEALNYVLDNIKKGSFAFAKDVDATWGGEAFGTGKAAMTIEGPWIEGAIQADWPDRHWTAIELPEGPSGRGTGAFTNCWGIAQQSDNKDAAVALVKHLISEDEQKAFTQAFGPIPSRSSLTEWTIQQAPEKEAFVTGLDYGRTQVAIPGFDSVLNDFNAQLEAMAKGDVTPEDALQRLQQNGEDVIADAQ